MNVLETERLILRQVSTDDTKFIIELLNEPSFIQHIGDKGVRTVEDAQKYILSGPVSSYEQYGFGLYIVELKGTTTPIGMCGLIKREGLDDVDIGYAFLPRFWSKGFAFESAAAVMKYGREVLGLKRIIAITSLDNESSIKVLEKIGLRFEKIIRLPGYNEDSRLFTPDA